MAMSVLFPLVIFSRESSTERFFKISNLGLTIKYVRPSGSLRIPRNRKRGGQGPGPRGRQGPGPRPWAASFVVPGNPEAVTGSPVFVYGSQVANLENRSVVTTYTKILKHLQIDMAIC